MHEDGFGFHVQDVLVREVEGGGQFRDGRFEAAVEREFDGDVFFARELWIRGAEIFQ